MTKLQREVIKHLLVPGNFMIKTKNVEDATIYKIYDQYINPIIYVYTKTLKSILFLLTPDEKNVKFTLDPKRVEEFNKEQAEKRRVKAEAKKAKGDTKINTNGNKPKTKKTK